MDTSARADTRSSARDHNRQAVIRALLREGAVTRTELVESTGLAKPTISAIVRDLELDGLVHQTGRTRGHVGPPAAVYAVNPDVAHVIGVDLGGTKILAGVANVLGEIVAEDRVDTDPRGGEHVVEQVCDLARSLANRAGVSWSSVAAVAVGSPGVADPETGWMDLALNISTFEKVALRQRLIDGLGIDVDLDNDVNMAARGEQWQGLAEDCSNVAFIAVGTGVGMGLIVDGEVRRGHRGAAGEIGYLPIGADPLSPRSRARGAFEEAVGAAAIVQRLRLRLPNEATTLTDAAGVPDIFDAAATGDPLAVDVVDETARVLALGIAAVIATVDPERIILGGGIGSNPVLLPPLRNHLAQLTTRDVPLDVSALGMAAALRGAVAVALSRAHEQIFGAADRASLVALPGGTIETAGEAHV